MKSIFAIEGLALALVLTGGATQAQSLTSEQVESCRKFGQASYNVMISRQLGVPQTEVLGQFQNLSGLVAAIVSDAYAVPRYDTDAEKVRISEDFREESETLCLNWFQSGSEVN